MKGGMKASLGVGFWGSENPRGGHVGLMRGPMMPDFNFKNFNYFNFFFLS
jgi:hypothetical protein